MAFLATFMQFYLDKEVPVSIGREVAEKLGQCRATFYPGEGHISVIVNHAQDIVSALNWVEEK